MLITLVPLFDEELAVEAYSVFCQKNNMLQQPMLLGTGSNDGAGRIPGLELISEIGLDVLTAGKPVFVPVSHIAVFSDLASECPCPAGKIVLLFDDKITPEERYVERIKELKKQGFGIAFRKIPIQSFAKYDELFRLTDYIFLNQKKTAIDKATIYFGKLYPNVRLCAGNLDTQEDFESLKGKGYAFYEGNFYRVAVTRGSREVTPLKYNYIELLNTVNEEGFELSKAADIISQDAALTISLLKIVNRFSRNSTVTSIRHAAAMLGQKELKKWINTAVVNELYSDSPSEVTRVSLLRAKFMENLAGPFGLAMKKDELFLMGIFSLLDVIMDKPMEEALEIITVTPAIKKALIEHTGEYAQILDFVEQYEAASFQEVSRVMVTRQLTMEDISQAYMDSLRWYKEILVAK